MNATRATIAAGLLAGALAQPAAAFGLGPFIASQVVTLEATLGSPPCPGFGSGTSFDTMLLPDGTSAPFAIPEGQVLVVTRAEVLGFGVNAGTLIQARLWRSRLGESEIASRRESEANASGRIFHIYEFSPGLVVASGTAVCLNANQAGLTMTGHLQGFFKRDN